MADNAQAVVMNPAFIRFVTSIAMRIVALVAGALLSANVLTADQVDMIRETATSWLAGLILAGVSLAYGLIRAYIDRRKLLKAMALPFPVTEKDLEARIKTGGAPPITTPKDQLPGPSTSPKEA